MNKAVRGALAGLLGTGLMTLIIAAGKAARLLWLPPPTEITERAEEKVGVRKHLPQPAFDLSWLAAHVAYGMACGVLYALVRPYLSRSPAVAGLEYGNAVWAVSYLGLMPALGLYPWPGEDLRSRLAVMIAAHAVFGVTTAEVERKLAHRFLPARWFT